MFAGCHSANPAIREGFMQLASRSEGLGHIPFDDRGSFAEGPVILLQQRQWNTAESKLESGVIAHAESKTRICAWARIDNRDEIIAKLPPDLLALASTDTGLILAAYLNFGRDLCENLLGDFAFAIHDGRDNSFLLGRDHLGVRPLFYYWNGKDFAFATSQAVLDGIEALDLKVSENWLARALLNCSQDQVNGAFNHVFKVPPAHCLSFKVGEEPTTRPYFEFSPEANLQLGSDDEYVKAYREILHEAVRCRVRTDYPVASESSGGLDASTVTAIASQEMPNAERDLRAYGFANCVDEPPCIMELSQRFALKSTHLITSTANSWRYHEARWPKFFRAVGTTPERWIGFTQWPLYEPAQMFGTRTMLSGFGGDEFVSNPGGMARIEFLATGQWSALARSMRGSPLLQWLRAFKFAWRYQRSGASDSVAEQLMTAAEQKWQVRIVQKRFDGEEFHELATAAARYDSGCRSVNEFALNNRLSPAFTARLENCTLMAAAYGLDYRWPLLDVRLLKFYLSVPPDQKLGPQGMTRYLHRRAIDPLLPDQIAWRDKSMGDRIARSPGLMPPLDSCLDTLAPELQLVIDEERLRLLSDRCAREDSPVHFSARLLSDVQYLHNWLTQRRAGYPDEKIK